jgi:hypothetical protein
MAAAPASAHCLGVCPAADVVSWVAREADLGEEDVCERAAEDGCPVCAGSEGQGHAGGREGRAERLPVR